MTPKGGTQVSKMSSTSKANSLEIKCSRNRATPPPIVKARHVEVNQSTIALSTLKESNEELRAEAMESITNEELEEDQKTAAVWMVENQLSVLALSAETAKSAKGMKEALEVEELKMTPLRKILIYQWQK